MKLFNQDLYCETQGSAGFDISSNEKTIILPHETKLVHTGLYFSEDFKLTSNEWLGVYSRSGLAFKKSVFVLNSPGVVDSDYPGEICVILHNLGKEPFDINVGDRIAQGIIHEHKTHDYVSTKDVERVSGFGSTGNNVGGGVE